MIKSTSFADPPLPQGNPIDKFGYEIGKAGIISVEIDANPKPQLEWLVRDQTIKENSIDSTGRIQAEAIQDMVGILFFSLLIENK